MGLENLLSTGERVSRLATAKAWGAGTTSHAGIALNQSINSISAPPYLASTDSC